MPLLYLSPSTQEFNHYVNGGTEEFYMNLIADAMIPYLRASGIRYIRNTPDMTAASSIAQSNSYPVDLHVALHSNAAPDDKSGEIQGSLVFYYPTSHWGQAAADIVAAGLREIYPQPDLVRAVSTTTLGEVARTRAPSILIEFAYHDNPEDAQWIKSNIQAIAKNVVRSLTRYFGLPFLQPAPDQHAVVRTQGGPLRLRDRPNLSSPVIGLMPNGARVTVTGQWEGWKVVEYQGLLGFADARYLRPTC
ncbi:MAG: N-acetylmuramoyl-L-alanine amidase [Eubacteriales bacterium]|jgi:N-acetylmuramoyl-L-alanine amidase